MFLNHSATGLLLGNSWSFQVLLLSLISQDQKKSYLRPNLLHLQGQNPLGSLPDVPWAMRFSIPAAENSSMWSSGYSLQSFWQSSLWPWVVPYVLILIGTQLKPWGRLYRSPKPSLCLCIYTSPIPFLLCPPNSWFTWISTSVFAIQTEPWSCLCFLLAMSWPRIFL